jgi:hypothetical protein
MPPRLNAVGHSQWGFCTICGEQKTGVVNLYPVAEIRLHYSGMAYHGLCVCNDCIKDIANIISKG